MYPVSTAFLTAVNSNTRKYRWTGTITTTKGKTYNFENKDIVQGSGYITREICGSSEIELGSVYASEMGITLFSSIDRYSLENAEIRIFYHLTLADGTVETVPMGVFFVAEANRKIKTLEIKAYDAMLKLDKTYKAQSSGYPYDLLNMICTACRVEMSQTKDQIEALPNGSALFGIYPDNDIETWRDLLHYLAQSLGCYAVVNRLGKLELRTFGNSAVCTVKSTQRFSSSFSDFVTRYTAVSSTNKRTNTAEYYALSTDDGLTMNLGINPLLQYGLKEKREAVLKNILNSLSAVNYLPFDSDTIGNPALDVGDVIKFSGGQADEEKIAAITSLTYKINGKMSVKCVGKNPRLAGAKSKNDKNIVELLNSVEANKTSVYSFVNALPLEVGEEKLQIIKIEFATQDDTDCTFQAVVLLNITAKSDENLLDGQAKVSVFYVLDDTEIEVFQPIETWHSGAHILNLFYPLIDMKSSELHTIKVLLSVTNGSAGIAAQNILATLTGQGMGAQSRWDGKIEASDEISPVAVSWKIGVHKISENAAANAFSPETSIITTNLSAVPLKMGIGVHSLSESIEFSEVIAQNVIDISDKDKMSYDKTYVSDENLFELRKNYSFESTETKALESGAVSILKIDCSNFESVTSISVNPFTSEPSIENVKYLLSDLDGNLYTVVDSALSKLEETELSDDLFLEYGLDSVPDGELLLTLSNPIVYCYYTAEVLSSSFTADVTAVPLSQVIYSENIDVSDSTIIGIENVTADCDESALFAVSFDKGESWYAFSDNAWALLSEEKSGMSKSAIESISTDAWAEMTQLKSLKFRIVLSGENSFFKSLTIDYLNTEG